VSPGEPSFFGVVDENLGFSEVTFITAGIYANICRYGGQDMNLIIRTNMIDCSSYFVSLAYSKQDGHQKRLVLQEFTLSSGSVVLIFVVENAVKNETNLVFILWISLG